MDAGNEKPPASAGLVSAESIRQDTKRVCGGGGGLGSGRLTVRTGSHTQSPATCRVALRWPCSRAARGRALSAALLGPSAAGPAAFGGPAQPGRISRLTSARELSEVRSSGASDSGTLGLVVLRN